MKQVLVVIYKFIRGIIRLLFTLIVGAICFLIKTIGGERDKKKVLTVRKAKRIRVLTNFKIKMLEKFPFILGFLGERNYLENLKNRLNYGV